MSEEIEATKQRGNEKAKIKDDAESAQFREEFLARLDSLESV
jgi:hypothetical protein